MAVHVVGRPVEKRQLGHAERALGLHGLVGVDDERPGVVAEELIWADDDLLLEELHGGRQVGPLLLGARELPVEQFSECLFEQTNTPNVCLVSIQ